MGHWAREETLPRETWNFLEKSNKMKGGGGEAIFFIA